MDQMITTLSLMQTDLSMVKNMITRFQRRQSKLDSVPSFGGITTENEGNGTAVSFERTGTLAHNLQKKNTQKNQRMSGITEEDGDEDDVSEEEEDIEEEDEENASSGSSTSNELKSGSVKSDFSLKAPSPRKSKLQSPNLGPLSVDQKKQDEGANIRQPHHKTPIPKLSTESVNLQMPMQNQETPTRKSNTNKSGAELKLSRNDPFRSSQTQRDTDIKRSKELAQNELQKVPSFQPSTFRQTHSHDNGLDLGNQIGIMKPSIQNVVDALMKQTTKSKLSLEHSREDQMQTQNDLSKPKMDRSESQSSLSLLKQIQDKNKSNTSSQKKFDPSQIQTVMNIIKQHQNQNSVSTNKNYSFNLSQTLNLVIGNQATVANATQPSVIGNSQSMLRESSTEKAPLNHSINQDQHETHKTAHRRPSNLSPLADLPPEQSTTGQHARLSGPVQRQSKFGISGTISHPITPQNVPAKHKKSLINSDSDSKSPSRMEKDYRDSLKVQQDAFFMQHRRPSFLQNRGKDFVANKVSQPNNYSLIEKRTSVSPKEENKRLSHLPLVNNTMVDIIGKGSTSIAETISQANPNQIHISLSTSNNNQAHGNHNSTFSAASMNMLHPQLLTHDDNPSSRDSSENQATRQVNQNKETLKPVTRMNIFEQSFEEHQR
ncbi:hypothetical protein FGO68_gene9444 [Halteria grandinella]|uniref:Uncharacterized protein n=1 Tax=Halteria grandinella TaxID=5974 RepID=A0A8J8T9B2_HALGN|nr:hypothetical protein FGO68_gene9444 [Halteria grandinella]